MNVAIDTTPLIDTGSVGHRARGIGSYTDNLKRSVEKYFPKDKYIYFTRGQKVPNNVDILHYPYFEPFFLTLPLKKIVPAIVTVHDLIPLIFPNHFPAGIRGRIKWQIQKFSLNRKDAIITDSESSKKDIIKYTGINEEKVHVIYLAAAEEFKRINSIEAGIQNFRKKYNLPEKFVLYVGDATWNKNLPRLCEAVLKSKIPLAMAGKALASESVDGTNPWNHDLITVQKIAEGNKQIIRLGFVPQEDLITLYNLANVFTAPSIYEGFGLPILEAMSCGCPVVTTKEGSLPEVAGNAALYVNAFDVESIAGGINEVLNNGKLSKDLVEDGYIQAKKFSWEKVARQTHTVYEKILAMS